MVDVTASGVPGLETLRIRAYRGPDDLPALVAIANAASRADGVTAVWTPASLRVEIEGATHPDPRADVIVATIDGSPVGYARVEWADTTDGERHYWADGQVHPDWRRMGIGRALLALSEERRRVVAASHEHPGPRRFVTWLPEGDRGGAVLLAASGYEPVRTYHHMVRPDLDDLVVPTMPAGLEIRPVTPELVGPVFAALVEAFRDHFGAHDGSPEAFARWRDDPDLDLDLLVIGFDGADVAGGVQGSIVPEENRANDYLRGWVDPVFTRRPWRRRGLASALLGRALVRLRERGMTSAQLDVDTRNANEALTLYERHGFRSDRTETEWHKPLVVP
jgi:GNAT superfamily N-acetyltransferase